MTRIFSLILLTALVSLLSGCSVFGIATKSELAAAVEHEAVQQQAVEAGLADLGVAHAESRADLDDLDARLRPRLASLDSAVADQARQVEAATLQWRAMQVVLVTHLDSLQVEYRILGRDVAAVRQGMSTVSDQASRAQADSRQAMRLQYETLTEERERLLRQLDDLEQRLLAWPTDTDSVSATVDSLVAGEYHAIETKKAGSRS